MEQISMDDLYEKLDHLADGEVILDVRTPEEYHAGHIKGARNIPHDEVFKHIQELRDYKTIYIHCKMGGRANAAADTLRQMGLTNLVCIGSNGMKHWMDSGYPVVND